MSEVRISVIVPVYNVEKYLAACLDSVLMQTVNGMEVICVDDGSTDGSSRILEQYAARDARIAVLRQPNGGLSAARNAGLSAARGKYLMFLDSDDKLAAPDVLEALCARAEEDALDMLFFDGRMSYESEALRATATETPDFYVRRGEYPRCTDGQSLYVRMSQNREYRPNAYLYLLRRTFLEETSLRFPDGVYHEDEVFTPAAMALAKRAGCTALCCYDRLWREGSIMSEAALGRRIRGNLLAAKLMLDFAQQRLAGTNPAFLRLYKAHARAINLRGARQYDELSADAQRAFLEALPAEERPVIERQLRLSRGERSARSLRLALKRLLPRQLWEKLRSARHR